MKKSKINALMREYVRKNLSPTKVERTFISSVYESIQNLLGQAKCLQIGSYSRFTAITPLHDLDVLYILGKWIPHVDPSDALDDLQSRLKSEYKNPTGCSIEISRQRHSVTIIFSERKDEVFSVDIVPTYISGQNYLGNDMYVVPEIVAKSRGDRKRIAEEVSKGGRKMEWIPSDPRGYISVATQINASNDDFRKSVKLVKGWRTACKKMNDSFALKSFHIEQVITEHFKKSPRLEIFDAIFDFFCELPNSIEEAHISDRADPSKKIDAYVKDLNDEEKKAIIQARDCFLIKLEELKDDGNIAQLLEAGLHKRASDTESYLFDQKIPMLAETEFSIKARVLQKTGGFREKLLDSAGLIEADRKIEFSLGRNAPDADVYKWKVKNDNKCEQPRGEITDHRTKNNREDTRYNGKHYVECYAIKAQVCIARARQNVVLHKGK